MPEPGSTCNFTLLQVFVWLSVTDLQEIVIGPAGGFDHIQLTKFKSTLNSKFKSMNFELQSLPLWLECLVSSLVHTFGQVLLWSAHPQKWKPSDKTAVGICSWLFSICLMGRLLEKSGDKMYLVCALVFPNLLNHEVSTTTKWWKVALHGSEDYFVMHTSPKPARGTQQLNCLPLPPAQILNHLSQALHPKQNLMLRVLLSANAGVKFGDGGPHQVRKVCQTTHCSNTKMLSDVVLSDG